MPSAARAGRHPDPAIRQRWQQRLQRFRDSGLSVAVSSTASTGGGDGGKKAGAAAAPLMKER
jgi:hypothetical protein